MDSLMRFLKDRKKTLLILFSIVLLGFLLRTYNHKDWLHFESDQSRDAITISRVLSGEDPIPLLGPQARGSGLLLGPIFYYFQIVAGFLGNDSPNVLAWPDALFSILFLPLLWVFLREFASEKIAFLVSFLAASSLMLVIYGRFAWNPNSLPFFSLLSVFSLLKMSNGHKKLFWSLIFGLSAAVATQLHFIFLILTPFLILGAMFFFKPRIKCVLWIAALAAFTLVYVPVLISETKTDWANSRAFFETVDEKGTKNENHGIGEKIARMLQETSRSYWTLITSDQHGDNIVTKNNKGKISVFCDRDCKNNLPYSFFSFVFFIFSVAIFIKDYQLKKANKTRNAYVIIITWLFAGSLVLTILAYQISPRFYLLMTVPFFVIFSIVLEKISESSLYKNRKHVLTVAFVLLVSYNLFANYQYFSKLASADKNNVSLQRDAILSQDTLVTFGQLEKISDYAAGKIDSSKKTMIIGDNRYARSFWYLINRGEFNIIEWRKLSDFEGNEPIDSVLVLLKTDSVNNSEVKAKMKNFALDDEKSFGTLTFQYYLKK